LHVFLSLKLEYEKAVQFVLFKTMYDMTKLVQRLSVKYPAILNISGTGNVALM